MALFLGFTVILSWFIFRSVPLAPYQNPALSTDERVVDLLNRMTLAEKIGQMALIEKNNLLNPRDITRYGLGAVLSGGGSRPHKNTATGWFQMIQEFQDISQKTRLQIPLLYGADAIHGHGNVPGATLFPHAIGLGASKDEDLVREVARATGQETFATGVNWIYAPNLDVAQDLRWGRVYETFGSDPKTVGTLGKAYIDGLQSFDRNGLTIVATAKHYLGNGSAIWGSSTNKTYRVDQGNSSLNETNLRADHLEPFKQAVEANVPSIMVGLNQWNGEKISFSHFLLTDVLKKELNFQGFLVSDWYGVYANETDEYAALVKAVNAGMDMVMLPFDYVTFSKRMHRAVASGDIPQARVDDAVRRILKAKFEAGLFDSELPSPSETEEIGSKRHRELARTAVRKSLVALKNTALVPISKRTPQILVAGSAADNIGRQSGGWTVEWQGIDGNTLPGTTILKGIQDAVSSETTVEYEKQGIFSDRPTLADVGIAVVGEAPYAEGVGDNENPSLSPEDLEAINSLKKVSKKVIVIIISGRPLEIKAHANQWDAIIAAWLPGSEGQGVTDVLFGDHPFTGSLPVVWEIE